MCARLLACPLCSQPGFLTLDALRAGLISVATRPLMCPVCNEVLLGIDKLTIHLFSHTINLNNATESSKHVHITTPNENLVLAYSAHNISLQDRNTSNTEQLGNVQISKDNNNRTFMEPGGSIIDNKISILNSQSQTQNQNSSVKNIDQHTFISDYNYDMIKVNIVPKPNGNHTVVLKPTENFQETSKANCTLEHFCNDNIKQLGLSEQDIQVEKETTSQFPADCEENQIYKSIAATKITSTDTIHQDTETSKPNKQCIRKEKLMKTLINKEDDSSNFQSIQEVIQSCVETNLLEKHNDKQNLRETAYVEDIKDPHQNIEHKQILPQTYTKIFRTIAPKDRTERCNVCGFYFSDTNILILHKQLVHMIDEQDLNNIPEKLLKNYSCHLCSKVFKMRGSLMVHMRVAHVGYNLGPISKDGQVEFIYSDAGYNCPTCGKKFKKEQHVIQHLKTHEGKQWECDICNKMFTTKYFLKKHKRLHSGEMPYKCNICDKNFTFQQSYHKHRLYHKDDKPHTCTTCGRSFKELSTLHNHERIHTGEKPFACETCGKCFRQRVSYLVHRRIHTGVMPYKCTMCGKNFRYKVSQRTHKCPSQVSENIQQFSTTVQEIYHESAEIQNINTLQESQSVTDTIDNENNKFVLIINDQGQHILARQSEIDSISAEKKEGKVECENEDNINKELKNKTWNINDLNFAELENFTESNKKVQVDKEETNIKNTNDFFSMVMSSFENSMTSPTFEMEHLRVSSPKEKEHSIDSFNDFPQISDDTQINITDTNVKQNLNPNSDDTDSLQTINEESLKELLYGIDRK